MAYDNRKIIYVENLRILLTILIVLLHIAVTYGSTGAWYYYEHTDDIPSKVLLTIFSAIVQSFSLGFFFMISAYFTPDSFKQKGAKKFLKGRFLRLGIPLLIFYFIVSPTMLYIFEICFMKKEISLKYFFDVGPLWFVETLLVFNVVYALWMNNTGKEKGDLQSEKEPPKQKEILIYAILLLLASFIVRIWYPIGKEFIDFQLAFFPGYISLFIVGIIANKYRWFDNFSEKIGKNWLAVSLVLILLLPFIMFCSGAVNNVAPFLGGFTWQSLLFSAWEAFAGIGMISGLLVIFRKKFNNQDNLAKTMSNNAYAVYIIHAPVIVFFTYSIRNVLMYPLLKFLFASFIGVPLCFLTSHYIIKKIPFIKNIL